MAEPTGVRRVPVTVTVDAADLREWAGRHADSGHHGVAHVLYQAAEGVESITEQHAVRCPAAQALQSAADQIERDTFEGRPDSEYSAPGQTPAMAYRDCVDYLRRLARANRVEAGQ